MNQNSYFLWDLKTDRNVMIRVMAFTREQAFQKADMLIPGCIATVIQVCEYWMPGVQTEKLIDTLEKLNSPAVG